MTPFQLPKKICTGFQFLEGPVWVQAGTPLLAQAETKNGGLIFSDLSASEIHWLADDRTGVLRQLTGQANGSALDQDGCLVSCEHDTRRVSRLDSSGNVSCVVTHYDGKRLNSPNDVAVRSDGSIFFTDPPYGVCGDDRELDFQGVYCVRDGSSEAILLAGDFSKPNGLAFSVDESELYVADTERGHLRRFSVAGDGELSSDIEFCRCERPDGICLDRDGNVWVACLDGVEVFDRSGRRTTYINLPERPANLAFGGADLKTLYICARTSIYRLQSEIAGALRPPAKQPREAVDV
jgi:sugar lactone lactonase YvrE